MGVILIVDDEAEVRASIDACLRRDGHVLIHAENGRQCEAAIARHNPDLVILDVVMPEQDGLETIRALRRTRPNLKILAVSGGGEHQFGGSLHFAREFGAHAGLAKPLDLERLRAAVRSLLEPGRQDRAG